MMQPEADPNPLRQRTGSASPPALCLRRRIEKSCCRSAFAGDAGAGRLARAARCRSAAPHPGRGRSRAGSTARSTAQLARASSQAFSRARKQIKSRRPTPPPVIRPNAGFAFVPCWPPSRLIRSRVAALTPSPVRCSPVPCCASLRPQGCPLLAPALQPSRDTQTLIALERITSAVSCVWLSCRTHGAVAPIHQNLNQKHAPLNAWPGSL